MNSITNLLSLKIKLENKYIKYLVENNDFEIKRYSQLLSDLDNKLLDMNFELDPLILDTGKSCTKILEKFAQDSGKVAQKKLHTCS